MNQDMQAGLQAVQGSVELTVHEQHAMLLSNLTQLATSSEANVCILFSRLESCFLRDALVVFS